MNKKTALSPSLKEESDELIFLMMADEVNSTRNEGFQEFYARYGSHLFNSCLRLCKYHQDTNQDAQDLTADVLLKIYSNADKYKQPKKADSQHITNNTKAWINKVALKEYLDQKDIAQRNNTAVEKFIESQEDINDQPIIQSKFVREAMECISILTEKQQDIIRAYYTEKDPTNNNARGREGSTQALADEYGTTQQNIRQIIRRAKKSIYECVRKRGIK